MAEDSLQMSTVHGLRVITASKHDGCINSQRKHGFSCSTICPCSLALPADTAMLHCCLCVTDSKSRKYSAKHNVYSQFRGSILCVLSSRGRAAVPASPAPPPPHAASGSSHPAAPYLPPLPCVRPSRCSRAASTSFTLRHRAPGESQPPLVDKKAGVRPPPQPARRSCCCALVAPCGGPHSFLLPARFCGASFKRAADQWSCCAGERKTRAGQPGTLPG